MQKTTYTVTERRPGGSESETFDNYDAAIEHAKKISAELEPFYGTARCSYSNGDTIIWSTPVDELDGWTSASIELRSTHLLP